MLAMLDLLLTILKYGSILTIIRLISAAFGVEFGVSRQYLQLLELLFQLGQRGIEKVESEIKLNGSHSAPKGLAILGEELNDRRDASSGLRHSCSNRARIDQLDGPQKLRRISTPEGPPVFLLDDYDDEDEDEGNENTNSHGEDRNSADEKREDEDAKSCIGHDRLKREFCLADPCKLVVRGVSAIIDDQVTKRFTQEELKTWNLLTRTNARNYQFMSRSLGLYWLFGFLVRYMLLMPLRIMFTLVGFGWLISTMSLVGLLPRSMRDRPYRLISLMSFRMLSCGLTTRLKFHNRQYRARNGDICVANHTSPIDVVLLACDNCYALVGQRHGGLLGILERALSKATNHVWFDRSEMRDRQLVTLRLKEHIRSRSNLPVLIFPEGTCINNSAVMMFRKGSFETTDRVCPVAIKYDPRFGDPFWNSSKQSYIYYLLLMMSSWAIKCDVWYLPPMIRLEGESSAEFANRVKAEIARQGGLVDLAWDGQLKRSAPKLLWKYQQQEDFVNRLKLE